MMFLYCFSIIRQAWCASNGLMGPLASRRSLVRRLGVIGLKQCIFVSSVNKSLFSVFTKKRHFGSLWSSINLGQD